MTALLFGLAYAQAPVFVAPLQPRDPALLPEARRLSALLEAELAQRRPIATIAQVPPWPDYSADVYMMSCPPGSYSGCALVCGDRIAARYTIGGTVAPGFNGGVSVDLVFIENGAARELLAFGMALDGDGGDAALVQGVEVVLGKIAGGAFASVDLRAVDTDPNERARMDAIQRQILADQVAELERQQGQVARQQIEGPAQQRVSRDDTAALKQRDDVPPWERLSMSEAEYVRYRNSGKDLPTWRRLRRGRLGELVGRLGIGVGGGPFGQQMDSRYALDAQLQLAELEQYQYISSAPHVHVDLEAGFGVLPFLDVAGHFAYRNSQFEYFINQEKVGDPVFLPPVQRRAIGSWQVGARASFVPFPARGLRPAAHAGVAFWQGTTWQSLVGGVEALQPMQPLTMLLLQVGPGVELTGGENLSVFVRALVDVPIGGNLRESFKVGGPALQERADPSTFALAGPGVSVQAGFVGRLRVIGAVEKSSGSRIRFEDEEP